MYYTIYKVTNKETGEYYIGKHQTKNLMDNYMGSGNRIVNAIRKYGKENFTKEILFVFDNEMDMNAKEAELVTVDFCKLDETYNICPGGQGGWGYIRMNPEIDAKQRASASIISKKFQTKRAIAGYQSGLKGYWFGKSHSEETKKKIGLASSINQSGNKNSQFGSMWITNGTLSKKIPKDSIIPEGWKRGRHKFMDP